MLTYHPFHAEITYYFVSTSPKLSWICNPYTDICITLLFHSSLSRSGDTHELKQSRKTVNDWFEIWHEQMFSWCITYIVVMNITCHGNGHYRLPFIIYHLSSTGLMHVRDILYHSFHFVSRFRAKWLLMHVFLHHTMLSECGIIKTTTLSTPQLYCPNTSVGTPIKVVF